MLSHSPQDPKLDNSPPHMHAHFLPSQLGQSLFETLRQSGRFDLKKIDRLSPDEAAFLACEWSVRAGDFTFLKKYLTPRVSAWVRIYCETYVLLFTHPAEALKKLDHLNKFPLAPDLCLRLRFWEAHLNLLSGKLDTGERLIQGLNPNKMIDPVYRAEAYVIVGLAHYYLGRAQFSIDSHFACQTLLEKESDLFLQIFNASMAMRSALKLAHPGVFEFFVQKLEACFSQSDDRRYRLRQTGYRAMILSQIGEQETAENYWHIADQLVNETESNLERGQYHVLRGISYCFVDDLRNAQEQFTKARTELEAAGPLPMYMAELEVAEKLQHLCHPTLRGMSLERSVQEAKQNIIHFESLAGGAQKASRHYYEEAVLFCKDLLRPSHKKRKRPGYRSLVLSIYENVSHSQSFASGLSHFRLIPNFIHRLQSSSLDKDGIQKALEKVLGLAPLLEGHQFSIGHEESPLSHAPEIKTLLGFASTLLDLSDRAEKAHSSEALANLAGQIAHDVRSPLTALRMFTQDMDELGEEKAVLIRSAIDRIQDIANNLLIGYRNHQLDPSTFKDAEESLSPQLLFQLTEKIISEKRAECGNHIQILHRVSPSTYGSFANIQMNEYLRVLSNLINNSFESIKEKGTVRIDTFTRDNKVGVQIQDNGCGIPAHLLPRVTQKGLSHGKAGGSGLGLYHAKEKISSWGGTLSIDSSLKWGTSIEISLPKAETPAWFVPEIRIPAQSEVVVLDDQPSVHNVWDSRLRRDQLKKSQVSLWHFFKDDELQDWVRSKKDLIDKSLFLVDHQLIGSPHNGLTLIEELGLAKQAILVTSRSEEKSVIDKCIKLGVQMLPKDLAPVVPVSVA